VLVGLTLCVPEVALLPDQAPAAVQLVALVEDHVSVELDPLWIELGLAEIETVGAAEVEDPSVRGTTAQIGMSW